MGNALAKADNSEVLPPKRTDQTQARGLKMMHVMQYSALPKYNAVWGLARHMSKQVESHQK